MGANRAISEDLVTLQSAAAATGNGTPLDVAGCSAVAVQVTGTFVATVTFEISLDGTNFVAVEGTTLVDRDVASAMTAAGIMIIPVAGVALLRARVSAWTSGAVTVKARPLPPGVAEAVHPDSTFSGSLTLGNVKIQDGDGSAVADVGAAEPGVSDKGLVTRPAHVVGTLTPAADVTVDGTSGGVTVLASNAARKGAIIQNVGTANLRIGTGSVTATTGTQLVPGQSLVLSAPYCPTAAIKAIREGATSTSVSVVEITA